MWVLPKGVAFIEALDLASVELPKLLGRFRSDAVTGYAHLRFPSAQAYFLFIEGRFVDAVCEEDGERRVDLPAISRKSLPPQPVGPLGGWMPTASLPISRALCTGSSTASCFEGQNLALIDVRSLLAKVKCDRLTGALRVYSADRSGLIFFLSGNPLGFFHDGSESISTSANEYQKIASLPGTKVDLHAFADGSPALDLLEVIDTPRLWATTLAHHAERRAAESAAQEEAERRRRGQVIAGFTATCGRCSRPGPLGAKAGDLVDRILAARQGVAALADPEIVEPLLSTVEKAAKLLVGSSRAAALRTDVATLLAERQSTLVPPPSTPLS